MSLMKYAFLIALTAVAVVVVPGFFKAPPPITIDGFVAPGFEEVRDVFRENFETGRDARHGGSAFSFYHQGEKVVDLWGGYADVDSQQKWKEDTLTIAFSSTKAIASVCIAMQADRGLLDYSKPVADYWPEFAQKGKGEITVRQMMEHKAGVTLAAPPGLSHDSLKDVARAGELMAAAEPQWTPDGHTHGYHAFTFGPLTNELLRRVDPQHRTLGQFFREEVAEPFGIDFHIGLPLELNYRVARLLIDERPLPVQLLDIIHSPHSRQATGHMVRTGSFDGILENINEMSNLKVFNDPAYRALEIPSANGFATARGMAKLFSILVNGGTDPVTNKTLLSKERVEAFLASEPPSADRLLGVPISFSHGMIIMEYLIEGVKHYGHPGAGGQEIYADHQNQVAMGFVSSQMQPYFSGEAPRFTKLVQAAYRCIKKS